MSRYEILKDAAATIVAAASYLIYGNGDEKYAAHVKILLFLCEHPDVAVNMDVIRTLFFPNDTSKRSKSPTSHDVVKVLLDDRMVFYEKKHYVVINYVEAINHLQYLLYQVKVWKVEDLEGTGIDKDACEGFAARLAALPRLIPACLN
jgi:hypothetical protein